MRESVTCIPYPLTWRVNNLLFNWALHMDSHYFNSSSFICRIRYIWQTTTGHCFDNRRGFTAHFSPAIDYILSPPSYDLHCRGHSSSRLPATASFILVPPLAPSPQAPCSPQTKSLLPLSGQAACLYGNKKLKAVIIAIISSSSTGARHPLCWRCLLGDIRAMGRLHNLPTLEGSARPDTLQQLPCQDKQQ